MTPQIKHYTQSLQENLWTEKMVAKWWQNFRKNIKKYELILKSGNYKKNRNAYKIRDF